MKKRSTQVMEFLRDLPVELEDDEVRMSVAKRDWCVAMLKPIDQRHEKRQKVRKPKKKARRKSTRT